MQYDWSYIIAVGYLVYSMAIGVLLAPLWKSASGKPGEELGLIELALNILFWPFWILIALYEYTLLTRQLKAEDKSVKTVDLVLYCPACTMMHIDEPSEKLNWANPPHSKHLCYYCGHKWRPFPYCTNGVYPDPLKLDEI